MKKRESNRRFVGWPTCARRTHATGCRIAAFVLMSLALVSSSACRMGLRRANAVSCLPALKYEINYACGSPRSASARVETSALHVEDSLAITATLIAAKQFAVDSLMPVESQTSMITVFPADRIVAPVARLTKGAKIGSVEDAERFIVRLIDQQPDGAVLLQRFHGVLLPEVTTSFCFLESDPKDSHSPEGIEVQVCQHSKAGGLTDDSATASLEIALVAFGRIKPKTAFGNETPEAKGDGKTEEDLDPQSEGIQVTETIFLEPRVFQGRDRFAIILPSPYDTTETISFAIAVDVRHAPDEDRAAVAMHTWSFNECMAHLTGAEVPGRTPGTGQSDTEWPGLENAIRALRSPLYQRRALLYLAERAKAPLVEDIALSGTDAIVGRLSDALTNEFSSESLSGNTLLGWMLERTAYGLLVTLLSTDQAAPELEAILVRHTGQVGRQVSTLEELITRAAGLDEFQSHLVRENFIYLEDISPAARTRAFEWLTAKGQAPEGYDPLAPLKERRAALNHVEKVFDQK